MEKERVMLSDNTPLNCIGLIGICLPAKKIMLVGRLFGCFVNVVLILLF